MYYLNRTMGNISYSSCTYCFTAFKLNLLTLQIATAGNGTFQIGYS